MIALGGLCFLHRLNCAQNWQESRKISQKWLRRPKKRNRGGFCDSAATEF